MLAMKIIPNIEMFLPHSISNRSTQVLGRGMDTHLRKHWIFVFSPWLDYFSPKRRYFCHISFQYCLMLSLEMLRLFTIAHYDLRPPMGNLTLILSNVNFKWKQSSSKINSRSPPSFVIFWLSFNCWFVGWLPSKIATFNLEIKDYLGIIVAPHVGEVENKLDLTLFWFGDLVWKSWF